MSLLALVLLHHKADCVCALEYEEKKIAVARNHSWTEESESWVRRVFELLQEDAETTREGFLELISQNNTAYIKRLVDWISNIKDPEPGYVQRLLNFFKLRKPAGYQSIRKAGIFAGDVTAFQAIIVAHQNVDAFNWCHEIQLLNRFWEAADELLVHLRGATYKLVSDSTGKAGMNEHTNVSITSTFTDVHNPSLFFNDRFPGFPTIADRVFEGFKKSKYRMGRVVNLIVHCELKMLVQALLSGWNFYVKPFGIAKLPCYPCGVTLDLAETHGSHSRVIMGQIPTLLLQNSETEDRVVRTLEDLIKDFCENEQKFLKYDRSLRSEYYSRPIRKRFSF